MDAQLKMVDLAFVVDTTGSMGGLIADAKARMIGMIDAVTRAADVRLNLGVVEYRDHTPQDTLVYRAYPMTGDLAAARRTIDALDVMGGGDGPEAVLAGVMAATTDLTWRRHARRLAVLVGDAPPHGMPGKRAWDAFPDGCPCGQTIESVTAACENAHVSLYTIALTDYPAEPFARLARLTGGDAFRADQGADAIGRLEQILRAEFGQLAFDASLRAACATDPDWSSESVADGLGVAPGAVSTAICRLGARDLLGRVMSPAVVA